MAWGYMRAQGGVGGDGLFREALVGGYESTPSFAFLSQKKIIPVNIYNNQTDSSASEYFSWNVSLSGKWRMTVTAKKKCKVRLMTSASDGVFALDETKTYEAGEAIFSAYYPDLWNAMVL